MGNEIPEAPESCKALLELAERCEAAAGPDRELDARIWCAVRGVKYKGHNMAYASYGASNPETQVEFTEPPKRTRRVTGNVRWPHATPITGSLDAAKALAKGKRVILNIADDEITTAIVNDAQGIGNAAQLALTAAALRSRACSP